MSTIPNMGGLHVPMLPHFKFQKAIYLIWKALYAPCGTFLFSTKSIFLAGRMHRLLSVSVGCISGERYISYKITH